MASDRPFWNDERKTIRNDHGTMVAAPVFEMTFRRPPSSPVDPAMGMTGLDDGPSLP